MSGQQAAEAAKAELVECEKEINSIKASVRLLGSAASGNETESPNLLSVVALKIEGLTETVKPKLSLQLSSPIEEITLTELFDPSAEEPSESMKASFRGVQTNQATLVLEVIDADSTRLGSADPLDVAPTVKFDAMSSKKEYESEVTLAVHGETKELQVCTVTLRLVFVPSAAEKRERLYELLTAATKKKASVVERLRRASMSAAASSTQMTSKPNSPSVRAGFLNKPKQAENQWKVWYDTYLGPESFVRRNFPVLKNYIIFFGAVGFFHYQGHVLALPPPV